MGSSPSATMRDIDTMFTRTVLLILAVVLIVAALMISLQRQGMVPAMRTFAAVIAELVERDGTIRREAHAPGPEPPTLRDRVLSATPAWRTFSKALAARLGPGAQLEIRGSAAGPLVWVHLPNTSGWIVRQLDLPRPELRGKLLAITAGSLAAIFLGAALLARQLTGPLRRLERMAERFAAGEPPEQQPVGGPVEIRNVHNAFVELWRSLEVAGQEREDLLAGVSHDLRTPVSRMRFAVGLHGADAHPRLIEELEHDLTELEQLAGQFIAYARTNYEEARVPRVLDEVVGAAVESAAAAQSAVLSAEIQDAGRDRSSQLGIEWRAGAPAGVALEAANIRRLTDNLIDNALRHGKPPIRVYTAQTDVDVSIVVLDGGPGIPAEHWRTALEPFTRFADRATPGSGLGLAIVNRIARRHGGCVSMRHTSAGFEVRVTLATSPLRDT
jgi:two-component system osmolarity sensor histidine kinase EnvZ